MDKFDRELKNRRQISITVVGRNSGRTITLPVNGSQTQWYRNLLKNPTITIRAGGEPLTLRARALRDERAVGKVIKEFRDKYTPEMIERLYPGPLDAAVKVRLQQSTSAR